MSEKIHAEIVRGWSSADLSRFAPERFQHTPATGSTNDDLLARARAGLAKPFDLIATDYQTRGRGRRGDPWEAAAGRNLLVSLALPLNENRHLWSRLPHLTAYLVGTAVESILGNGQTLQAKWPNDLLFHERKLAGILVEIALAPAPFAIVGIGLNVNLRPEEFPPELAGQAISLYEILGCESSRWFLLGLIMQGFLRHFPGRLSDFAPVLDWITGRDALVGKHLRIRTGLKWLEGTATGLGPDGELILKTAEGLRLPVVSAEEIQRI